MTDNLYSKKEKYAVLLASSVAIFITPAMGTMVNLALTSIGIEYGIGTHDLGWISTAFFIFSVMFLVPAARASNMYGKKKIFVLGLVLTMLGNLSCLFSFDLFTLCACRAITGIGAAFISCSGVSMITEVFVRNERGAALGINTAAVYLGSSLGPVIGGFLTDVLGWRSIFYIIVPFTIIALFSILVVKGEFPLQQKEPFGIKGSILYGVAVMITMLGLMNIPETWAILSLIAGLALVVLFYYFEKHEKYPVFNVRIFGNSRFSRALLATLLNYAASFAVTFFLSLYLQNIGALTATQAGLILLAQPAIQVVLTPIAGRWSDMMDSRILPTLGMAVLCVGLILLLFVDISLNVPLIIISLFILGVGYSLFSAPNTSAIMSYVRASEYSEASAMISTMRQVGMMVSLGIAMCVISVIMGSTNNLIPENYPEFVNVMRVSWMIFIGFSVVGCVMSWFRGKEPDQSE